MATTDACTDHKDECYMPWTHSNCDNHISENNVHTITAPSKSTAAQPNLTNPVYIDYDALRPHVHSTPRRPTVTTVLPAPRGHDGVHLFPLA